MLNKCDLVDEEWLEMMEEDVREELSGTFLEHAPLVKVSAATGAGLDDLVKEIEHQTRDEVVQKDIHTIPRLPIDRVFTLSGFGTIITGTLVSGTITKEDTLQMYPVREKNVRSEAFRFTEKIRKSVTPDNVWQINLSNVEEKKNQERLRTGASEQYEKYRPSGCKVKCTGFFCENSDESYTSAFLYRNQ